jgi:hypothetical protein
MSLYFGRAVLEGGSNGCCDGKFTSQRQSVSFRCPLKAGEFFESKMVRSFFVNKAEQLESQSWPMDNKLVLFKLGKTCASVALCGSTGIGRCPDLMGLIMLRPLVESMT